MNNQQHQFAMSLVKNIPGIDFNKHKIIMNNSFAPANQMSDHQSSLFLTEPSNILNNTMNPRLLVPASMNRSSQSPTFQGNAMNQTRNTRQKTGQIIIQNNPKRTKSSYETSTVHTGYTSTMVTSAKSSYSLNMRQNHQQMAHTSYIHNPVDDIQKYIPRKP